MKKVWILCLALVVLLFAACNKKTDEDVSMGVGDSIFDPSNGVVIDRPGDNTGEEQNTRPSIPDGPVNPGQLVDPTLPEENNTPTKPQNPEQTQPTTPEEEPPQESTPDYTKLDYLQFHALTQTQQRLVMESFESIEAFFVWYDQIKETYEKENPSIEVDGAIDLDEIFGGN